ncbi:phosphotransferase [Microcoleus sp. T2B6]|uniref:phosphotransferase n=1 Tax=Microcoleus sp. T2B6 TaxID=3055424 RepID=UPI002FD70C41
MNIFSQQPENITAKVQSACSALLGLEITDIEKIGGGRNSRVYKLSCENDSYYAAKVYFRHYSDQRNRLQTEFSSLQFLWENGVKSIPQPIAADRNLGCAVYEYIAGEKIIPQEVTNNEIDVAANFLVQLAELKSRENSHLLPQASEAFFSVRGVVDNIEQRYKRLSSLPKSDTPYIELEKFLSDDFMPAWSKIATWCQERLSQSQMSWDAEIEEEEKTLSPSDFGFHNAIRRDNGEIIFVDFEYFGWDDQAKAIADFLLHPAVELGESLKQRFLDQMLCGFKDSKHLAERVEIVYPLFGLKWCLILLNEFVPQDLLRRGFAQAIDLDRSKLQIEQLAKAKRMLQKILANYEQFPYGGRTPKN